MNDADATAETAFPWRLMEQRSIYAPHFVVSADEAKRKAEWRTQKRKDFTHERWAPSHEPAYSSSRYAALCDVALRPRGPGRGDEKLPYSEARAHGLSHGYNTFAPPPSTHATLSEQQGGFIVDLSPEGDAAAAFADPSLDPEQRAFVDAVLSHDPSSVLVAESGQVGQSVDKLVELNKELVEATRAAAAIEADMLADAQQRGATDLDVRSAAIRTARNAGNRVRRLVAEHQRLAKVTEELAHDLDAKWRKAQAVGESARRAALATMAARDEELQIALEAVELRLTDHVLLGTAEEAERMAKTPGPDGDQRKPRQTPAHPQALACH